MITFVEDILMKHKCLFLKILILFSILTACTTNQGNVYNKTITDSKTKVENTSSEDLTENFAEIISNKPEIKSQTTVIISKMPENHSQSVRELSKIYAASIMDKLAADSEDKYGFTPMNMEDDMSLNSVLCLIDIDFDGLPELFAGRVGTIGEGSFEVFKPDGSSIGTVTCASGLGYGVQADGYIYVFSGRNPYPGWVKLVSGFPSIHIMGFADLEGSGNDVQILDGSSEKILEGLTFEEYKALYPEYLGVDYDALTEHNETSDYIFAEGYLRVPDPENYTEEDIYNCLAELLSEYEKISQLQEE